jgi:hypothetical protein
MEPPSDQQLDLLLGRGKLRGPVAEQMREQVLDAVAPKHTLRPRLFRVVGPVIAMAAAASFGIVWIGSRSPDAGFRPKGAAAGQPVLLGLTCSNGTPAACHRGARVSLAFGRGATGYLGVYAEPEGGGGRIWYFSREDGAASLSVVEGGGAVLASRSILLGPEHSAGNYRVHVVIASRTLDRTEILDPATAGVRLRTSVPLTVLDP